MKSLSELHQVDQANRAADFTSWASLLLRSSTPGEAYAIALAQGASSRLVGITKAAVEGMLLSEPLVDLQIVSSGFVAALARSGVFDRMMSDGAFVRVPLGQPGVRISTTALIGATPAEGAAKPISRLNFTGAALERRKADAIVVMSDQLAEALNAGSQALLSRELRRGVVAATDTLFLDTISDGAAVTPSAGGTAADVLDDLGVMLDAMDLDSTARLYLVVSPSTAKSVATKADTSGARAFPEMTPMGGSIAGIPTLVSDHLPTGGSPASPVVMLIDASGIAADSEVVALDQATHATLEMSDAPTMTAGGVGSPSAPVASTLVSLWQTNSRGVRASRFFGFRRLRDDAVQLVDGGAW